MIVKASFNPIIIDENVNIIQEGLFRSVAERMRDRKLDKEAEAKRRFETAYNSRSAILTDRQDYVPSRTEKRLSKLASDKNDEQIRKFVDGLVQSGNREKDASDRLLDTIRDINQEKFKNQRQREIDSAFKRQDIMKKRANNVTKGREKMDKLLTTEYKKRLEKIKATIEKLYDEWDETEKK